jgi:4-amino-4-deoxy-L-arabinose transferase-like glycosyltransferase
MNMISTVDAINKKRFLFLFLIVAIYGIIDVRWLYIYRYAQPLDIDESGYLSIAFLDYRALLGAGPIGWLKSVLSPSIQAPLLTSATSLVFAVTGPHIICGLLLNVIFYLATIISTYFLSKTILDDRGSFISAALVGSCPIIINYSRTYNFAMVATLVMSLALLSLMRSDRCSRLGWSILFGLCLGLLPLARTMTIAFVPGLVAAAFISVLAKADHRLRRLARLFFVLGLAVLTATPWFIYNGRLVVNYLFSFGYNNRAHEYGPSQSFMGFDAWTNTFKYVLDSIYVPYALLVIFALAAFPITMYSQIRTNRTKLFFERIISSKSILFAVVILEFLCALTSSRNKGTGFVAPVVPPLIILSVFSIRTLNENKFFYRIFLTTVVVIGLSSSISLLDLRSILARPVIVTLPGIGPATVTSGRGPIQIYEGYGFGNGKEAMPFTEAESKAWQRVISNTSGILVDENHTGAPVALGFMHLLYNANAIRLMMLLAGHDMGLPAAYAVEIGNTGAAFSSWMTKGAASGACLLLTWAGHQGEIVPGIDKEAMEKSAVSVGFIRFRTWILPNGDLATLWRRNTRDCR